MELLIVKNSKKPISKPALTRSNVVNLDFSPLYCAKSHRGKSCALTGWD